MKTRIADENSTAAELLPPHQLDGSRIGVNHADAYIKSLNVKLEGGPTIACKRKGLKIMLAVGDQQGEAIMDRLAHGPDPQKILHEALLAAARNAGSTFSVDDGGLYLDLE